MRRKKDDKRVLRSGNGRNNGSKRKRRSNRNLIPKGRSHYNSPVAPKPKRKASGKVVLLMVIALIAFVIGAGAGIALSFEDNTVDEGPHIENVTKEMTTNLNDTEEVYYDASVDAVDFNENQTSQLDIQYQEKTEN